MKRTGILIIAFVLSSLTSIQVYSQPYWSGSTISTTTTGDCNVGGNETIANILHVQGGTLDMTIPLDPAAMFRTILGGTNQGGLSLATNASGASISLYGNSYPASAAGNISYRTGNSTGMHYFVNNGITNLIIGYDGRTIVGPNVFYSLIAPGDNLTVKDQLGFTSSNMENVNINGNCHIASLQINAQTNLTDGASLSMNSIGATDAGAMNLNTVGGSGTGFNFFGNGSPLMQISKTGPVNINNTLTVQGGLISMAQPSGIDTWRNIKANSWNNGLFIAANTGWDGAVIQLYGGSPSSSRPGAIYSFSYGAATSNSLQHLFLNFDPSLPVGSQYTALMGIEGNGKVIIGPDLIWGTGGSNAPDGYLLYVEKGILTEKLKVANKSDGANWSDFVFNKNYDLMPLSKVETFVKANKHLPEIPSASEVAKDGIDVANMDAKLLQKIEELTLYAIQQQKEIDELKQRIKH